MSTPSGNLAIFDLDYTLTTRGTWGRFVIMSVKSKPWLWIPLVFAAAWAQFKYMVFKTPRITVKQAMIRWSMQGRARAEIDALAAKFADREVARGLRPGALKVLERHRAQGDTLMIISAAADIIVREIAAGLSIPYWIGTDMAWDHDDKLQARFASPNCYGPEKVIRFKAYLRAHPTLKHNHTNITMYSDSYSDLEILTFADVGVAVNPDRRLRHYAVEHHMSIVDWSN